MSRSRIESLAVFSQERASKGRPVETAVYATLMLLAIGSRGVNRVAVRHEA